MKEFEIHCNAIADVEFLKKIKSYNQQAVDLMRLVGAKAIYRNDSIFAGGIDSFYFEKEPPAEWVRKNKGWYPKEENHHLIKMIKNLPTITKSKLANQMK